jgi:hypothetical protein
MPLSIGDAAVADRAGLLPPMIAARPLPPCRPVGRRTANRQAGPAIRGRRRIAGLAPPDPARSDADIPGTTRSDGRAPRRHCLASSAGRARISLSRAAAMKAAAAM